MEKDLLLKLDREILGQLATEQLVDIIIEQVLAIEQLKSRVVLKK
jgi:transposase